MDESQPDAPAAPKRLGISYAGVIERLEKVSDRISAQVRTLGLGTLAFTWGLLVGQSAVANDIAKSLRWHLLLIGALTIAALLLDFLQYVSGYFVANNLRATMEREHKDWGKFRYKSFPYRVQSFCFVAKQVLMIVTAIWLVIAIVVYLIARVF